MVTPLHFSTRTSARKYFAAAYSFLSLTEANIGFTPLSHFTSLVDGATVTLRAPRFAGCAQHFSVSPDDTFDGRRSIGDYDLLQRRYAWYAYFFFFLLRVGESAHFKSHETWCLIILRQRWVRVVIYYLMLSGAISASGAFIHFTHYLIKRWWRRRFSLWFPPYIAPKPHYIYSLHFDMQPRRISPLYIEPS